MTEEQSRVCEIVFSSPLHEALYWTDENNHHETAELERLASLALRGEYLYRVDLDYWKSFLSTSIRLLSDKTHEIDESDIRRFKRCVIIEESFPGKTEEIDREGLLHSAKFLYTYCHFLWNAPEEIRKRDAKKLQERERWLQKKKQYESLLFKKPGSSGFLRTEAIKADKNNPKIFAEWKRLTGCDLLPNGHVRFSGTTVGFLSKCRKENIQLPNLKELSENVETLYNHQYGLRDKRLWEKAYNKVYNS